MNYREAWSVPSELVIPEGPYSLWNDGEWELFYAECEKWTADEYSLVMSMLDDEEIGFEEALGAPSGEDSPVKAQRVLDDDGWGEPTELPGLLDDVEPRVFDFPDCDCEGPGSPEDLYTSHLQHCSVYDAWANQVEELCTCVDYSPKAPSLHKPACPAFIEPKYQAPMYSKYSGTYSSAWTPKCKHYEQRFILEDGLSVLATAYYSLSKTEPRGAIGLGVYFADSWLRSVDTPFWTTPGAALPWETASAYPAVYVKWPDHEVPAASIAEVAQLAEWLVERSGDPLPLELGCVGAHGRTGTMMACMLAVQGVNPLTGINRVWSTYCDEAIESLEQAELICEVYEYLHGDAWQKSKGVRKKWAALIDKHFTPVTAVKKYGTPTSTTKPVVTPVTKVGAQHAWKGVYTGKPALSAAKPVASVTYISHRKGVRQP